MKLKNILSIFLSSVIFFVFVTVPVFGNFLKNKEILDDRKNELRKQEQYFEQLKEFESNIDRYASKLELVDLAISDEFVAPSVIRYVETMSFNNGLILEEVISVIKEPSTRFSDLMEMNISFLISGEYSNFKNFIKSLENSIKIIEVEKATISFDSKEQEFYYEITIKNYYY